MKLILAIALLGFSTAALVGCGSQDTAKPAPTTAPHDTSKTN